MSKNIEIIHKYRRGYLGWSYIGCGWGWKTWSSYPNLVCWPPPSSLPLPPPKPTLLLEARQNCDRHITGQSDVGPSKYRVVSRSRSTSVYLASSGLHQA